MRQCAYAHLVTTIVCPARDAPESERRTVPFRPLVLARTSLDRLCYIVSFPLGKLRIPRGETSGHVPSFRASNGASGSDAPDGRLDVALNEKQHHPTHTNKIKIASLPNHAANKVHKLGALLHRPRMSLAAFQGTKKLLVKAKV